MLFIHKLPRNILNIFLRLELRLGVVQNYYTLQSVKIMIFTQKLSRDVFKNFFLGQRYRGVCT